MKKNLYFFLGGDQFLPEEGDSLSEKVEANSVVEAEGWFVGSVVGS